MAYFYDDVRMRLVEQRMEIENDRYYFINYCKKRKYQVTDDFYDCIFTRWGSDSIQNCSKFS